MNGMEANQQVSPVGEGTLKNGHPTAEFGVRALACPGKPLTWRQLSFWALIAILAFHGAYALPQTGFLILAYLIALLQLSRASTSRQAFYSGLAVGFGIAAIQMYCFVQIFSVGAVALWYVLGFWIGLFVVLARQCFRHFHCWRAWAIVPFLWLGLEYFRSELYYLRFSWLNAGYAFAGAVSSMPLKLIGMYGTGFLLMSIAAGASWLALKSKIRSALALGFGAAAMVLSANLTKSQQPDKALSAF